MRDCGEDGDGCCFCSKPPTDDDLTRRVVTPGAGPRTAKRIWRHGRCGHRYCIYHAPQNAGHNNCHSRSKR